MLFSLGLLSAARSTLKTLESWWLNVCSQPQGKREQASKPPKPVVGTWPWQRTEYGSQGLAAWGSTRTSADQEPTAPASREVESRCLWLGCLFFVRTQKLTRLVQHLTGIHLSAEPGTKAPVAAGLSTNESCIRDLPDRKTTITSISRRICVPSRYSWIHSA